MVQSCEVDCIRQPRKEPRSFRKPLTNRKARFANSMLSTDAKFQVAVPWPPNRRPRIVRGQSIDVRAPASEPEDLRSSSPRKSSRCSLFYGPVACPGSRAGAPSKTRGQHLLLDKNPCHVFVALTQTRLVSPSTRHSTHGHVSNPQQHQSKLPISQPHQ